MSGWTGLPGHAGEVAPPEMVRPSAPAGLDYDDLSREVVHCRKRQGLAWVASRTGRSTPIRRQPFARSPSRGSRPDGWELVDDLFTPAMARRARRWFKPFRAAFPDVRMEVVELVEEGETVVARFACSATHAGPWQGHDPSGRRSEDVAEVYFFRFEGRADRRDVGTGGHRLPPSPAGPRDDLTARGPCSHMAVKPPSRTRVVPVTKRESSPQRKRTAAQSSSLRSSRPTGRACMICSRGHARRRQEPLEHAVLDVGRQEREWR